jgi:hypothetical protein
MDRCNDNNGSNVYMPVLMNNSNNKKSHWNCNNKRSSWMSDWDVLDLLAGGNAQNGIY